MKWCAKVSGFFQLAMYSNMFLFKWQNGELKVKTNCYIFNLKLSCNEYPWSRYLDVSRNCHCHFNWRDGGFFWPKLWLVIFEKKIVLAKPKATELNTKKTNTTKREKTWTQLWIAARVFTTAPVPNDVNIQISWTYRLKYYNVRVTGWRARINPGGKAVEHKLFTFTLSNKINLLNGNSKTTEILQPRIEHYNLPTVFKTIYGRCANITINIRYTKSTILLYKNAKL